MRTQTRRRFLTTLALGATAATLPCRPGEAAEPRPEITTVRFAKIPAICFAPQYVCDELLRAEGFTDIQYVDADFAALPEDLGHGRFDFASSFAHRCHRYGRTDLHLNRRACRLRGAVQS